jgi:dethiobiotin synthetase
MTGGFFVTGTDTGVGKTTISSALISGLVQRGKRVAAMKPVASGCVLRGARLVSEDVERLVSAMNVPLPTELVNPYAFEPPLAPHIAAEQAGVTILLEDVQAAFKKIQSLADMVIVEGVGGFQVPLNAHEDTSDLAVKLELPVILVVGMRLGCLNHALLTAWAIRSKGLVLAGWVANQIDPGMTAFAKNLEALESRIQAPCLGVVPFQNDEDALRLSKFLKYERILKEA